MANDILNNIWPEWQIVRRIGKGSFGIVYEAVRTDHSVESRAAIKVISIPQDESEIDSLRSEGLSKDATRTYLQGVVNDFVSEIQLMESFKGVQNIVSVEDYKVVEKKDKIGWDIYIRMELLTPFHSYICDKTLSENEVIKLGVDICTALELCAKRQVIHRDIKPENLFINQFGDFKLGDFGIARKLENLTGGLSQKGTYNYMAPEIEKGYQYDATVDLYSLGLVLYRLLNKNRLPFLDTERQLLNPNERMAAIRRRMDGEPLPAPCDASPAMAQMILCACSPDPSRRFSSATSMKNALVSVANGTYAGIEDTLDKTMSVRHAAQAQDPNQTVSVRKAPQAQQAAQKTIGTFGEKKKSKAPAIIAIALVAVLLIGGGVFALPRLLGNGVSNDADEPDGSATGIYSDFDEEQISAAIEEAEALAAEGDYESALTKIKTALVTYPESEALQEKETAYTDVLAAQIKEQTLEEAANLAESGDYVSALALIQNAQETYGDDADYKSAYDTYCEEYKNETIILADNLAASGDYAGAIQKINDTCAVIGNDDELVEKEQEYTKEKESQSTQTSENENSQSTNTQLYNTPTPFYGVWCSASKNQTEAENTVSTLEQKGFDGQIFITTDWSNLNSEMWYVVTAGVYSTKSSANTALSSVRTVYPNAYVKYSGDYQGSLSTVYQNDNSQNNSIHPAFYGIWCGAAKTESEAQEQAEIVNKNGFEAQVFVTTDWSNLNSIKWYVAAAEVYLSEEEAAAALPNIQAIYPDAYIKYSGNWLGQD